MKLLFNKFIIVSFFILKLLMATLLDQFTLFHDHNTVSVDDGW